MSLVQTRGGVPYVVRVTGLTAAGQIVKLPFYTQFVILRNQGANACRLFFTAADFTGNKNYVIAPVASATYPYGEWAGPVETTAGDHSDLWVKSDVAGVTTIELIAFQRRG